MNDVLMRVENVTRSFQSGSQIVDVLKGIDIEIEEGEILVMTGASGVGKSTFLHILGGLDRASSGEIFFRGEALSGFSEEALARYRNVHVGFIFQFHHLLPEFSAVENVAMPLLIRREPRSRSFHVAETMLERVGLKERLHHKPGELSGGEQQRVALARAIVTSPDIVLADEPTGNLDEETSREVFELICELNRELGITFFIATHNLALARAAHRWLRMTDGKVSPMTDGSESLETEPITEGEIHVI